MISLEKARKQERLDKFAKEHPSEADARFWPLLDAMAKGSLEAGGTSDRETSVDCSGTQIPSDTSQDVGD